MKCKEQELVSVYAMLAAAGCLGLAAILGPETSKGALEDVSA